MSPREAASRRLFAALLAAALSAPGLAAAQDRGQPAPILSLEQERAFLKDAIDIHVHLDPDSFGPHSSQAARALDVLDMAARAKAAGMAGFVVKQHYDQTAQIAYLAAKSTPGVEVFGMLVLNHAVGGLNPEAVYHFAEVKGGRARIVSMPTWDSANGIAASRDKARPAVAVSKDGELLPEAKAVIAVIAKARVRDSGAGLALATGHISAPEALMVLREAKAQGITRMVATHAMGQPINMSLDQMKQAAALGAYIEFVGNFIVGERVTFAVQQYADAIRALGPEHVILSSDAGQSSNRYPDELLALTAKAMLEAGFTPEEVRKMTVENPARLLGLAAS